MATRDLILVAMLLVVWGLALGLFRVRNWRGWSLAALATGGTLFAGMASLPFVGYVQATICGLTVIVFLTEQRWVAVASEGDYDFVRNYVEAVRRFNRPTAGSTEASAPLALLADLEASIQGLERASAPAAWTKLKAETVGEMRTRIKRIRRLDPLSSEERAAAEQRWRTIQQDFRELKWERIGFWTGFPWRRG